MSDLTKAIERIDAAQLGGESLDDEPEYRAVELVTNTARRWADGVNIEWCIEHAASMINRGGCGYDPFTPCRPVARILLTPPGDTNG